MPDVLANEGSIPALDDIQTPLANWRWILFSNLYIPVNTTTWAALTECTFPGYGRINAAYNAPIAGAVDGAQSTHPAITFTCTGGGAAQNVYGYALVDTTVGTKVLFAQQVPAAPKVMVNNGDSVTLTPLMTLRQG